MNNEINNNAPIPPPSTTLQGLTHVVTPCQQVSVAHFKNPHQPPTEAKTAQRQRNERTEMKKLRPGRGASCDITV